MRVGVTVVAGGVVLAPAQAAAPGSPTLTTSPSVRGQDDFPSQAQVDAARAAAAGAAGQVNQVQGQYDAATVELQRMEGLVAQAAARVGEAEQALAERTAEADAAATSAASTAASAQAARQAVRRDASLIWQDNAGPQEWTVYLSGGGPQDIADRASSLEQVSAQRRAALERAASTASAAVEAQRRVTLSRAQQESATIQARDARAAAQTQVEQASTRVTALQAEQDSLVAELARLKGVAAQVEQDRQDGLAAKAAREAAERAAAEAARRAAEARAAQAAAAAAAAAANAPKPGTPPRPPTTTPTTPPTPWVPNGGMSPSEARATARAMMGNTPWRFDDSQWGCLDSLWMGESSWRWSARNPSSGAYGIPQSLPATKMSSAGDDWLTNPVTQISWGLSYIKGRYGSPCAAWQFWQSKSPHWY